MNIAWDTLFYGRIFSTLSPFLIDGHNSVFISSLPLTNHNHLLQRGNYDLASKYIYTLELDTNRNRSITRRVDAHARSSPSFLPREERDTWTGCGARENERARQMELGMPRQINGSGLTRWRRGARLNLWSDWISGTKVTSPSHIPVKYILPIPPRLFQ